MAIASVKLKGRISLIKALEISGLAIFALCAFVYFRSLYCGQGLALAENPSLMRYNTVFGADIPRVVGDLTDIWANHYRTKVHPLFVLLLNPIGSRMALSEPGSGLSVSIRITSVVGALCPTVFFGYLLLLGTGRLEAAILSLILGFSASQILWSSVPETFIYGTLTLLITHSLALLAARKRPVILGFLPFGGLLSLGITTTNYFQAVVAFAIGVKGLMKAGDDGIKRFVKPAACLALFILISMIGAIWLSNVQKARYPSAVQFYKAEAYDEEPRYMYLENLTRPFSTLRTLTLDFAAFALIGPPPDVVSLEDGQGSGAVFTDGCFVKYGTAQKAALLLWAAVIVVGLYAGWVRRRYVALALIACVGVNYGIHSVYGTDEAFLYSAHVLYLFSALAGLAAIRTDGTKPVYRVSVIAALLFILTVQITANLEFMDRLGLLLSTL